MMQRIELIKIYDLLWDPARPGYISPYIPPYIILLHETW